MNNLALSQTAIDHPILAPLKKKAVDRVDLEQKVKLMYKKVAEHPEEEYHFEMGRGLAERLGYPAELLDQIPQESIASFAGVGHYFDLAELKEGEIVLDLGSGSGMDVFCAAKQVGEQGEVIGIDMTKEQLLKSKQLQDREGIQNVLFREGHIERLSIVPGSIDAVISNGVVNLSSEKEKVFMEAARVLKKGGRLVLSDIVTEHKLPENITCDATLWAACIGGAMQVDEYSALIERAGLRIEAIKDNPYAFISNGAQGATRKYGIKSISILALKN